MIKKNKTWELVDRLKHRKVIGVKWVFRTKINYDGSINKYKTRIVFKDIFKHLVSINRTPLLQ